MTKAKLTSTPVSFVTKTEDKIEKGATNDGSSISVEEKSTKGQVKMSDRIDAAKTGRKEFTPKEAAFLKGMVEEVIPGKRTQRDLALEVYNAKSVPVADSIASENLSKPKFKDALRAAFEAAAVTPDSMAQVISEAMLARKTTYSAEAQTIIETELPDHGIRIAAVRAAGVFLKDDGDSGDGKMVFNFNTNHNSGSQAFVQK